MRHRKGKGQIFALDAKMNTLVDVLQREKGFYPTLREIGEMFNPPLSPQSVKQSFRRLSVAGKLSDEARMIYDAQKTKQENERNEGTKKGRKVKK